MVGKDSFKEFGVFLAVLYFPALIFLGLEGVEVVGEGGFKVVLDAVVIDFDV